MPHGGDIYRNHVELDYSVNLNPAPPPSEVFAALRDGMGQAQAYPDLRQERVRGAVAAAEGVTEESVAAGNGASEMILAAVRAVSPGRALLAEPCFSGYRYALNSLGGCEILEYRLREEDDFELTADFLPHIMPGIDLLFLTDPWNPTGKNIPGELLREILETAARTKTAVLLDLSFFRLSEKGRTPLQAAALTKTYENLILVSSFTKLLGLPGIRMGYAVAAPEMARRIRRQLPEWNLSTVSACGMAACAGMLREGVLLWDPEETKAEREYLTGELEKLGCRVCRSDTLFLLFHSSADWYGRLLEKGILIRDCSGFPGLSKGYYRIAVKDHTSNRKLIQAMREVNV